MKVELTTTPSEQDAKTISQGIVDFNHKMIPNLEPLDAEVKFSIFVRDDDDKVIGGIRATCYWNTLHIELLWLSQKARGGGVGSEMIKKAEQFALENHCEQVFVSTTSWQAKPFYEKQGYQLAFTLPDYPKDHASHFLTKRLV